MYFFTGNKKEGIILVTGEPRSGTSLMMQTLSILGFPIAGEKFPEHFLSEKNLNPKGFYEIPGTVSKGVKEIGPYSGKAIKVICNGAYQHDGIGTPDSIVSKYILCVRNPYSVAKSQNDLKTNVKVCGDEWSKPNLKSIVVRYIIEYGKFLDYVFSNDLSHKIISVDYDDMRLNTKGVIERISVHLNINPANELKDKAVQNISGELYRSKEIVCLNDKDEIAANKIYQCLLSLDRELWLEAKPLFEERLDHYQRESVKWYDEKTGILANAHFHRMLRDDEVKRSEVINGREGYNGYIFSLLHGLHPQCSPDYSISDEFYTIERPYDFGNLCRNKVYYRNNIMTVERAFVLHQSLWSQGNAKIFNKKELRKIASKLDGTIGIPK